VFDEALVSRGGAQLILFALPLLPCISCAGGAFNLMSRRVLGTNAHLAEAASGVLSQAQYAPDEPPALGPLQ
jgi:hypothetical protein